MVDATKVIVVDDSYSMREILRSLLISEGYKIVGEYGTGCNLLAEVTKSLLDIICLDYHLADSNC